MSCHTWAYRMATASELKDAKEHLTEVLKGNYQYVPDGVALDEHVDHTFNMLQKTYGDDMFYTKEQLSDMIGKGNARIRRLIKKLQGDCTMKDVAKAYENYVGTCTYKVVGDCLYKECGFDEPCRIYGYPEETFTDADKFIEWIKASEADGKQISECYDKEEEVEHHGFDELMERKNRRFWAKFDNKVYVEFG